MMVSSQNLSFCLSLFRYLPSELGAMNLGGPSCLTTSSPPMLKYSFLPPTVGDSFGETFSPKSLKENYNILYIGKQTGSTNEMK